MSVDFRIIDYNYLFDTTVDLTASTEDSNFPVSNLRAHFTEKVWRSTADTAILDIDLKTEEEIDSFAMVWDPELEVKLSDAAVIKLQANATPDFTSPAVDVTLSIDDDTETALHFFSTAQSYRYWRLDIDDTGNPWGYIEVPKLFLGEKMALTKVPQTGFSMNTQDPSKKTVSLYGHEYNDIYPQKKSVSFELIHLPKADSEILWNSYGRAGTVRPILCVIDSEEEVLDKYRHTIYGRYDVTMSQNHIVRELFGVTLEIKESL